MLILQLGGDYTREDVHAIFRPRRDLLRKLVRGGCRESCAFRRAQGIGFFS